MEVDNWGTIGVPGSTLSTVDLSPGPAFGLVAAAGGFIYIIAAICVASLVPAVLPLVHSIMHPSFFSLSSLN